MSIRASIERMGRLSLGLFVILSLWSSPGFAFEDPTRGRPFFDWVWEDQFKPTFKAAGEPSSLWLLGTGIALTAISFSYDDEVRQETHDYQKLSSDAALIGSQIGSGAPGIAIAIGQLFFDQKNGLQHARALALTSATHITIALTTQRSRPNEKARISFPSGHTSSTFATATSLAYSYGWFVGVPAYGAAGLVAASKWADNQHWFSDTVAGAALGIYWGRASAISEKYRNPTQSSHQFTPVLLPGGAMVVWDYDF